VTAYFRIGPPRAHAILAEVVRAVDGWRRAGSSLGMSKDELDGFADAFEHSEREAARKVL